MVWFKIKQLNVANSNIELSKALEEELSTLIPEMPLIDMPHLQWLRQITYYEILAQEFKYARKFSNKRKIDIRYASSAIVLGLVEAVKTFIDTLSQWDPAAGELLKRHIKDKVASWK